MMIGKLTWPLRMALAELRCEWLFSFGVGLAVCSVLTPIMLLWGAKTGVVDSLRTRLLNDPRTRELIPIENNTIPLAWFESMASNPRVGFIVPSARLISLYGNASSEKDLGKKVEVSLIPTSPGDPLGELPASGYPKGKSDPVLCMVSSMVAEDLSLEVGNRIILEQSRFENNSTVRATFPAVIHKVLSSAESKSRAVYLPLNVTEYVEDYKDGREVPAFGWTRAGASRLEVYDSVRVRPIDATKWTDLVNAAEEAAQKLRLSAPARIKVDGVEFIEFTSNDNEISGEDVDVLLKLLVPIFPLVNLHIKPIKAQMELTSGSWSEVELASSGDDWFQVSVLVEMLSTRFPSDSGKVSRKFKITNLKGGTSNLILSFPSEEVSPSGILRVGPKAAGALCAARKRSIEFISSNNSLRPLRTEYLGFRLYAKNLEDVKPLRIQCAQAGIETSTQEDRISQVISLDRGLKRLFMFIAVEADPENRARS
jgi:putative ABC transport system permease protein